MLTLTARSKVSDDRVEALVGKKGRREDFDAVLSGGDATVYKPSGERLLTVVRGGLSGESRDLVYPFLHGLSKVTTQNRGNYSGEKRFRKVRRDGTLSNTTVISPVRSAVVGFIDRYPRMPFCNCLSVVKRDPEGWASCQPMLRDASTVFATHCPARHAAQMEVARRTHPAYVIGGTPFTTITVNNTFAGGYHRDAGDFEQGFGVMAVLRRGEYRGCELILPAYRLAVDLRDRDVILFDVHEVHGNAPFEGAVGREIEDHERISVVFYFRKRMTECLPPEQERERAKKLRGEIDFDADDRGVTGALFEETP